VGPRRATGWPAASGLGDGSSRVQVVRGLCSGQLTGRVLGRFK
jgi:hypothetical protein